MGRGGPVRPRMRGPYSAMTEVTRILLAIERGDPRAAEQLLPLVYQQLRELAAHRLAGEKPGQTLQATALVHEAYLRLVGTDRDRSWDGLGHCFAAAAEAMRRILIDRARDRKRLKRGGGKGRQRLDLESVIREDAPPDLDDAITRLSSVDACAAVLVKLRLFAGLSLDESASTLGVVRRTAERPALALMDHPNIARVFDAGTTDAGRPFFVMELVKGIPITQYCDEARLSPRERLELFIPVCQAIQHAHQKGIIHRDVKPSNVLVTLIDGKPVPKVIDFGIAKATDQRPTEKSLLEVRGEARVALATAVAFAALLIAAAAISLAMAVRVGRERDRAVSAESEAKSEGEKSRRSAEESRAVLKFFQEQVLAAARPEGQEGGLGREVTIRQAVDAAKPRIGEAFRDQPTVEAVVRDAGNHLLLSGRIADGDPRARARHGALRCEARSRPSRYAQQPQ
jgi:RNA polymerase sigma factor (TIGR02999 family)